MTAPYDPWNEDLVTYLRARSRTHAAEHPIWAARCGEAADEIERRRSRQAEEVRFAALLYGCMSHVVIRNVWQVTYGSLVNVEFASHEQAVAAVRKEAGLD